MKNININFHKTFKAEGQYISSILEIADGKTWFTTREISEMTGIPQGKSSGKVEPHINYAEYMGLIKSEKEKKEKKIKLTKTELGDTVQCEDPGLQEKLTKLLLHAMMLRDEEGACVWNTIFKHILPQYHNEINKDILILELNKIYDNRITKKNIAPVINVYNDFFSEIGILDVNDELIRCNSITYDNECVYMYALVLWKYWEEYYPQQEEISSTQFAELRFGKAFGWDTQREYEVMEYLADKGLIRMNRQLMPYTILKLVNEDKLLDNLYSELC